MAKLYTGNMIAPGSDVWGRPSAWPNSWTATANRLKPKGRNIGFIISLKRYKLHKNVNVSERESTI